MVTDAQPGPAAGRSGPLKVVTSSVSRVLTMVRSQPADATESAMRQAGKGEVAIEYRLVEHDGRWAVYDVAVDGVSLISNYRSQFSTILKRMSFAQLLDRMRNREASVEPRQDSSR